MATKTESSGRPMNGPVGPTWRLSGESRKARPAPTEAVLGEDMEKEKEVEKAAGMRTGVE